MIPAAAALCWAHVIEMEWSLIQLDALWPLAPVAPVFESIEVAGSIKVHYTIIFDVYLCIYTYTLDPTF